MSSELERPYVATSFDLSRAVYAEAMRLSRFLGLSLDDVFSLALKDALTELEKDPEAWAPAILRHAHKIEASEVFRTHVLAQLRSEILPDAWKASDTYGEGMYLGFYFEALVEMGITDLSESSKPPAWTEGITARA